MRLRSLSGRACIIDFLRLSGGLRLIRSTRRDAVTILMVHGVMDRGVPSSWQPLRPQLARRDLHRCLERLSKYYQFVSLGEAVDMIRGEAAFKPHRLVLSFDDGYRNQLKHALPILEAFNAPAVFFLATGPIESRKPFWFDRLDYALQQATVAGRKSRINGGDAVEIAGGHREALAAAYKRLRDSAKRIARPDSEMVAEMESLAEALESESGKKLGDIFEVDDWSALLSWPEIAAQAGHPLVSFGSHTVDHTRLGCVSEGEAAYQAKASKEKIERHTGRECRFFCYPSGSFSRASTRVLKNCGYTAAVTTLEGLNRRNDHPFTLRRINLPTAGGTSELLWQALQLPQPGFLLGRNSRRALAAENRLGD